MMPSEPGAARSRPELSVAVVGICSAEDLRRCLNALAAQEGVPPLDIVVCYDADIAGVDALEPEFPDVRFFRTAAERSPLQLSARALQEAQGEYVLLTEDHCIPDPAWARALWRALQEPCGAAGGTVEIRDDAGPTDWAFYFVDFFRYARPVGSPESPTLTVCNDGYRRKDLEALQVEWRNLFCEPVVHDDLKRFGPLHLKDDARVTMRRHVRLQDAIRERYVFGRLTGASRLELSSPAMRWAYRLGSPILPALLLRRMAEKAFSSEELRSRFLKSFGPLALMVLAWSFGEWLGYWTGKKPADLTVAPEAPR